MAVGRVTRGRPAVAVVRVTLTVAHLLDGVDQTVRLWVLGAVRLEHRECVREPRRIVRRGHRSTNDCDGGRARLCRSPRVGVGPNNRAGTVGTRRCRGRARRKTFLRRGGVVTPGHRILCPGGEPLETALLGDGRTGGEQDHHGDDAGERRGRTRVPFLRHQTQCRPAEGVGESTERPFSETFRRAAITRVGDTGRSI